MAKKQRDRRKEPRQARSRATVDFILEAAAQILSQDGSRGLSTNRIAERAGVAVASLYQYFPNKQAIVDVLFETQLAEEREEFMRRSSALKEKTIREAIREGIESILDVHARSPTVVRSILRAVPFIGKRELHVRARQEVTLAVARAMRERRSELRPAKNEDMRAFLIVHAVEAAIHDAASERPDYLGDPEFAEELVDMVERFLLDG